MVTPISNDKIMPSDGASSSATERNRADKGTATQGSVGNQSVSKDENSPETSSVDVERANKIYSQSASKASSGNNSITNSEQAKDIAAKIRAQIEGDAHQALRAQIGAGSGGLAALLEAAPA